MDASNRLRVLQIGKYYPPYKGGMETHLQQLSRGLRKTVDLGVVVANDRCRTAIDYVDGVKVIRLSRISTLAAAPICPTMTRAIRDFKADLVHIHFPNPGAVVAYMRSNHRGPLVVTWHSDIVRQTNLAKLFQPLLNRFLRRCSAIIVSSPNYLLSSLWLSGNREKCHIIPFGIPVEPFQHPNPNAVADIHKQFGSPIVLTVGRLVYYKGLEFLIKAMRKLHRGRLLIVGDGPLRQTLERQARASGVADRVVFLGSVANLAPYYQACDVFVLPSIARSEAFGIVQLEALASGKPIVNTWLASGVPYVSPDGVTGLSVAPGDSDALANALNRLIEDPELRIKFGQEGVRRVMREFTAKTMISRTLDLYYSVMNGSPRTVPDSERVSQENDANQAEIRAEPMIVATNSEY